MESGHTVEQLAEWLRGDAAQPHDQHIRHLDGQRQVAAWQEVEAPALQPLWKAQGVYLVTGGLGGLGRIFAADIARHAPGATLVLTGRRELDDAGRQQLRELEAMGATATYHAIDASDRSAVRQALLQIREDHGTLDGILHSAGVIQDSLLLRKTEEQIRAVLSAKVHGLVHLDEASSDIELDWFIGFSSISAALGNLGQTDYAAANGFMDEYLRQRQERVALGQRHGRSLSINWPLWKHGGMHVGEAIESAMERNTGMVALPTAEGLQALQHVAGGNGVQAMLLHGQSARLRQWLGLSAPAVAGADAVVSAAGAAAGAARIPFIFSTERK